MKDVLLLQILYSIIQVLRYLCFVVGRVLFSLKADVFKLFDLCIRVTGVMGLLEGHCLFHYLED